MRFGVDLCPTGPQASPERIRRLAERAEALGFDSVWVTDHVVIPTEVSSTYPYGPPGSFNPRTRGTYYEPLVTMAWVAGATQHVRIGVSVLVVPYRNPVVAAKQIATLDNLSGGRIILGVGVGWMEEEFEALAVPHFRRRGALTDEYIRLYRALWTEESTAFDGEFYRLREVIAEPKPAQPGGPPIWVGGNGAPAMRRTVDLGQAWHAIRLPSEELREKGRRMAELAAERSRPVPELTTRCSLGPGGALTGSGEWELDGDPAAIAETLDRYASAGCTEILLDLFPRDSTEAMLETMERFATEIRPILTQG